MNRPTAILIAGANGSGKTTFARQVLPMLHAGVAFINADEIQRQGGEFEGAVAAAREFLRLVDVATDTGQPFALETTLASRTYLARIARWRSAGYRTVLHFIDVPSADFAVGRVQQRVASGATRSRRWISGDDSSVADSSLMRYTRARCTSGTDGIAMTKAFDSSPVMTPLTAEQKHEVLLEAARRANWDAMHGPAHLRTGRFFVSQVHAAHLFTGLLGVSESKSGALPTKSEPAE